MKKFESLKESKFRPLENVDLKRITGGNPTTMNATTYVTTNTDCITAQDTTGGDGGVTATSCCTVSYNPCR